MKSYNELKDKVGVFNKTWGFITSKDVPFIYKLIPAGTIAYVLFPFDFITDILPAVGQMDDLVVVISGLGIFNKIAGKCQTKASV